MRTISFRYQSVGLHTVTQDTHKVLFGHKLYVRADLSLSILLQARQGPFAATAVAWCS